MVEANRPMDGEATSTCFSEPYTTTKPPCNCDARDPVFRQDIGIITNKDLLPIKSFNYGFMKSSYQKANITIGPLVCNGYCSCNTVGSKTKDCNRDGQCDCKENFIGDSCSECMPGYFGNECENQIRLQGGDSRTYGYIQVLTNLSTEWKSLRTLGPNDNRVADLFCHALGFPKGQKYFYSKQECSRSRGRNWSPCSNSRNPTLVDCNSQAADLTDCIFSTHSDISYRYYAQVQCREEQGKLQF